MPPLCAKLLQHAKPLFTGPPAMMQNLLFMKRATKPTVVAIRRAKKRKNAHPARLTFHFPNQRLTSRIPYRSQLAATLSKCSLGGSEGAG